MTEEESFPRGGRRIVPVKRHAKTSDNLFKTHKPPKAKKSKKEKAKERVDKAITEDVFHSQLKIQGTLSYSKLREEMIVLGCVRHITNFTLEIELPGLTFATVGVTDISDPFTKYLNVKLEQNDEESDSALQKIFKPGQFLPVKILKLESKDKGVRTTTHVTGSINPRNIYSDKNHASFKKGFLVWGCIQSVLDHGYEMSLGVNNCRVFLPSKNIDDGVKYEIGATLWCVIHKSDIQPSASTLRVSAKTEHISHLMLEEIGSLYDIIPGMQVEFVTDKVSSNGIHGKYLDNYFGYVNEMHLKKPLHKLSNYNEGKILKAYVLYVEPLTKLTHLTLIDPFEVTEQKLQVNEVVSGEVYGKTYNGIILRLPNKEKGFVSNSRLLKTFANKNIDDIKSAIQTKFPEGSNHSCRILDYNRLQKMYICTTEKKLINDDTLSVENLSLGQLVKVTIDQIKNEGIAVTCDSVRGYVPNLYVSNAEYSENMKKKFQIGAKVNARVLKKDENNVIFTLKQAQIDNENCLSSIEEAKPGNPCVGVVVKTKETGAMVAFYGGVTGWLHKFKLPRGSDGESPDPTKYFFRGQVINAWILSVDEKGSIRLTLKEPKDFKGRARIGEKITGIVDQISKNEILIHSKDRKYMGVIPLNHLSVTLKLCPAIKSTLKVGNKIENLICIRNNPSHLFSRREAIAFKDKHFLKKFGSLRKGSIIRCFYDSNCQNGINVIPFLVNYRETIVVEKKDILGANMKKLPKFQPHQLLLAKVAEINKETKSLKLSLSLEETFDKNVENVVEYFGDILMEIDYLRKFGSENNWDICEYSPGQRILCKVEKIADEGGCLVSLPNESNGLVAPNLCPANIQVGQEMQGVFLSQEFDDNYAEICLKSDIWKKINSVQDGNVEKENFNSCLAEKILIKQDHIIAVLKQASHRKQLIYIPIFLHPNDFKGNLSEYINKKQFKICICGKVGDYLIGMSKHLFKELENVHSAIENKIKKKKMKSKKEPKVTEKIDSDSGLEVEIKSEESDEITSENEMKTEETSEDNKDLVDFLDEVIETNEEAMETEENSIKSEDLSDEETTENNQNNVSTSKKSILPGISSFFDVKKEESKDSSSSDEDEEEQAPKKKKKMSATERAEALRQEEERIIKIENELTDLNKAPQSAAQFDRLVLVHPNSSKIWISYISFHIAGTEIDKARAVAKKALETINMTESEEKFKVWAVLLNLENMYGTKESFDKVFTDALKFNDSLKVYLQVIGMLAEAGKYSEMEEKVKKVKAKHKHEAEMWLELAKVYYQINNFKEARNMKDGALKSITDKKTQFNLIVKFAIMEFKYGEEDQGAAIFETILSTDSRKVTIWTTYVDQLVKKNKIDQARIVLERAVAQRLPLKSMRALFLKFRKFEEDHGTSESIESVKKRAQEYVSNVSKKV